MSVSLNGTNGLVFNDGSTQNTAATGFGFKNRIINGAMMIDQRNAGASVTPTDGQYTLDRWQALQAVASKYIVQQNAGSVTTPAGFSTYLGCTSSSAYTVGASEYFAVGQIIEGFNTSDLAWGTANAATVTLSFWVRSSLTGTFGGVIKNSNNSRSYPFTYTISAANTWEQKSITVAGDTSGTYATNNSGGIKLFFGLGVGSTYSGAAGSWSGGNFVSATGATSVVGTNGATFYITGVQLEKGSTATSFDYRPYGTELALCQRYYQRLSYNATVSSYALGEVEAPTQVNMNIQGVTMRADPTNTYGGSPTVADGGTPQSVSSVSAVGSTGIGIAFSINTSGGMTTGRCARLRYTTSSDYFAFSAEL